MIIQANNAPEEFLKRYNRIKSGQEKIKSVQQLKDFWLFAIGIGEKDIAAREPIARLIYDLRLSVDKQLYQEAAGRFIYMEWEVASTGMHRDLDNKDEIQMSNDQWKILKDLVSGVDLNDIYIFEDGFRFD